MEKEVIEILMKKIGKREKREKKKSLYGKILVRFKDGMTLESMQDLEERIRRNLEAVKKLDEFYRLGSAWLVPLTFDGKSHRKERDMREVSFDFPRKFPFKM